MTYRPQIYFNPELLKRIRKEKKMTQAELSEAAGLRQNGINDLEKGWRGLTVPMFQKMCEALNADPFQIMDLIFVNPLPADLVRKFRQAVKAEGKTVNQVLIEFMRVYTS